MSNTVNNDNDLLQAAKKTAQRRVDRILKRIKEESNERIPEKIARMRKEYAFNKIKKMFIGRHNDK